MSKRYRFTKQDFEILQNFIDNYVESKEPIDLHKSYRFECSPFDNEIYISNKRVNKTDVQFKKWYEMQPEYTPINITFLSILHEIGHIMTRNQETLDNRDLQENIYNFLEEQKIITNEEHNFAYFSIPCERRATMWGVEFYKDNEELCKQIIEKINLENF